MTPGSTGSTSTGGRSTATTRRPASTSSVRHRGVRARWPSPPPRDASSSRWRAGSGSSTGRRERGATGSRSSRRASAIASTTGAAIRPVDSGSGRCSIRLRPAMPRGSSIGSSRTGRRSTVRSGIGVANGLAFSPDGRTMYFADTPRETVWAYDYDVDTGEATNERVFLDFGPLPGRPDGAGVDEAGCYWIACVLGGMVLRVTPAGAVDRRIRVPVSKPTMPAFGGPGLSTLFITTIGGGGSHAGRPDPARGGRPLRARARGQRATRAAVRRRPGRGVDVTATTLPPVWFERPVLAEVAAGVATRCTILGPATGDDPFAGLDTAIAAVVGAAPFGETAMDRAPGLVVIARTGIGYDAIDVDAATRRGIAGLQHARRPDHLDGRACRHADAARRQEREGRRGRAPRRRRDRLLQPPPGDRARREGPGSGRLRPDRAACRPHRRWSRDARHDLRPVPPRLRRARRDRPRGHPRRAPPGRRRRVRPRPADRRVARPLRRRPVRGDEARSRVHQHAPAADSSTRTPSSRALDDGHLFGAGLDVTSPEPLPAGPPAAEPRRRRRHPARRLGDRGRQGAHLPGRLRAAMAAVEGRRPDHLVNPEVWERKASVPYAGVGK